LVRDYSWFESLQVSKAASGRPDRQPRARRISAACGAATFFCPSSGRDEPPLKKSGQRWLVGSLARDGRARQAGPGDGDGGRRRECRRPWAGSGGGHGGARRRRSLRRSSFFLYFRSRSLAGPQAGDDRDEHGAVRASSRRRGFSARAPARPLKPPSVRNRLRRAGPPPAGPLAD